MRLLFVDGNPDSIRAFAAAQTHSRSGFDVAGKYGVRLQSDTSLFIDYRSEKLVNKLGRWDHHSTREFIPFQIQVEDVSRVLSFWLMNYGRRLSFLQQSQRFVEVSDNSVSELEGFIRPVVNAYKQLAKYVPLEDARYILPQGVYTNFIMSGNLQGFLLAANEIEKHKFPNELYDFVDNFFDLISRYAKFSVEETLDKIKFGNELPTEFYYEPNQIDYSGTLERILDEDDLIHSYLTAKVNISRVGAHQLIRHRAMNRTIKTIGKGYITPPSVKKNYKAKEIFDQIVGILFDIAKEYNSEYFLPNASAVELKISSDLYNFIGNFLPLRTCYAAQWEIRAIAMQLRNQLEKKIGETLPIGRCFYYPKPSELSEIFPTRNCPESKRGREKCGIYSNKL